MCLKRQLTSFFLIAKIFLRVLDTPYLYAFDETHVICKRLRTHTAIFTRIRHGSETTASVGCQHEYKFKKQTSLGTQLLPVADAVTPMNLAAGIYVHAEIDA